MSLMKPQMLLFLSLIALLVQWYWGLFVVPADGAQGEVYRIIYLHVPSAFAAFLCAAYLLIGSLLALRSKSDHWLHLSRASTEVGLIFTVLTLATGSIWGKPTWGTWWTWDARLTTTFLLGLMYGGWLLLFSSMQAGPGRTRGCSILGMMIAADVPIIYKSVTWWRTLHQPQTILRAGGSTMDSEMLWALLSGIVIMAVVGTTMVLTRRESLVLGEKLEDQSLRGLP
jgi:heme exporter protein C